MSSKKILITGANSGIGYVTARELALLGHEIILVTRSKQAGLEARDEISRDTGSHKLHVYSCDLASLQQVRNLSAQLHEDFNSMDVLINNAGIIKKNREITEDGFEYQFAVNHLSHFLLTQLTIDLLQRSSSARIINVSSMAHKYGKIHFQDLNLEKGYSSFRAYAQSKLANLLFTYALCSKLSHKNITSNAVHPGIVGTRFGYGRSGVQTHPVMRLYKRMAAHPDRGARTSIFLAASPEVEGKSGGYYVNQKAVPSSRQSYDPDAATALWEMSLKMSGLDKSLI